MHLGFWEGIARDLTGKARLRLIIQPTMAILLGVRIGIADAKAGRPAFLWTLIFDHIQRWSLFKESLSRAVVPLTLALVIDGILQRVTLGYVRPVAAILVGALLVWAPFVATRGLTNRAWTRLHVRRTEARP